MTGCSGFCAKEKGELMFINTVLIKRILPLIMAIVFLLPACSGTKAKPDILLVTIDTLRRDHVGVYGYPRQTTPFIDELAKKGVMFKNVITPIPVTDGSHASILTSLHPLTHNVIINGSVLSGRVETLAEVLKKNGYFTMGAVAVKHLGKKYNFSQGFDSFNDKFGGFQRDAGLVNESLLKQIDEYAAKSTKGERKPFFIWLHYYDPHTPYEDKGFTFKEKVPERYFKMKPKKIADNVHRYDSEIRFVDEAIKKVLAHLKKSGMDKRLVTCITADHGEQHGEHGWHSGHFDLYSENSFVPLIFHGYRIPEGKTVDTFVSTMDIGVTLLKMAGAAFSYQTEGHNLMDFKAYDRKNKKRDFLILGYPPHVKALQLFRHPFSYILAFERYYKDWVVSGEDIIPAEKFKKMDPRNIRLKKGKTYREVIVDFPYAFKTGIHYAVLKARLEEGPKVKKKIRARFCNRLRTQVAANEKMENITVIHPVNALDRMSYSLRLFILPGTKVTGMEYAVLSEKEFSNYSGSIKKHKNEMFPALWTNRKFADQDELFDIQGDPEMNKNLLGKKDKKYPVVGYKKQIYTLFQSYYKKGLKLFKHRRTKKDLSEEQKKMLKTLGYL
jgi:arylsulfatase A-like enzyme